MFIITHPRRWLALATSCLALEFPALAQDMKCFILTPPEQILPGVKRLAIADFSVISSYKLDDRRSAAANAAPSQDRFAGAGRKLSDMLIAALLEKDRGVREVSSDLFGRKKEGISFQKGAFTNIFTIVERSEIERVTQELALNQSGFINDSAAAQAGKILGVEAIVVGSVKVECVQSWLKEERKGDGGQKSQVDCEHIATNVSGTIRIVRVEIGQVIGSKDSRRLHDQTGCKGATLSDPSASAKKEVNIGGLFKHMKNTLEEDNKATTPEAAIEKCLLEIGAELADYFAPSFKEQKLEFADVEGDEFKRMVETAQNALKNPSFTNLQTAHEQYATTVAQDAYNHGAQFNLGVLYEAVGNYTKAKEKYDLAYSMKSNDNRYRKAQERLAKQVEYWEVLNALGLELKPVEFDPPKVDKPLTRLQTKGPAKLRHEIKAEPNDASATIDRVPGEIELIVLETVTGWYKVRLPLDGKEGFLSQDKAKILK